MKELKELINLEEPGWEIVSEWLKEAKNHYEVLPRNQKRAEEELLKAQVTTRSPMGAIIYETGGILVDYGYIRILGSGSEKLNRGLMQWNKGKTYNNEEDKPYYLLIADDIVGGYFAINAGGIGEDVGSIYYLAPDTLNWENLNCRYSDFIYWTLTGDINRFYMNFKWKNWKKEVKEASGNETFSFFPFFWTKEGKDIEKLNRKLVPVEENYNLTMEFKSKL